MGKTSAQSYVSKFDRYGGDKVKKEKKEKDEKKKKGKKNDGKATFKEKGTSKLLKSLESRIVTVEQDVARHGAMIIMLDEASKDCKSNISALDKRIESLEKSQKSQESQLGKLGKAQKSLSGEVSELRNAGVATVVTTADVTESTSPEE